MLEEINKSKISLPSLNFIELGQFILSSPAEDIRLRTYEGLIKLGLVVEKNSNGKMLEDIISTISRHCKFQDFPGILIEPIIQQMVKEDKIKCTIINEKSYYNLLISEDNEMNSQINDNQKFLQLVYNELFENIEKKIGQLTKYQKHEVETAFDRYIGVTIGSITELSSAIVTQTKNVEINYPERFRIALETITNKQVREIFLDSLKNMFSKPSEILKKLIFRAAVTSLFIKVINLDPKLKKFERNLLSNVSIYVDTNIIFALILKNHKNHQYVEKLIKLTSDLGIKIKYSTLTREEFRYALKNAENVYNTIPPNCNNSSSPLVNEFLERRKLGSTESWNIFKAKLENSEVSLSKKYNLILEDINLEEIESSKETNPKIFSLLDKMINYVKQYGYWKSDEVVRHDALHMIYIQLNRGHEEFFSPWFLTTDHSLMKVDSEMMKDYYKYSTMPSSIHCDTWLQLIIPFISPQHISDDLSDIFCDFMATHFFVLSQIIDINKIVMLLKPIIDDIETMSEEEIPLIIQSAHLQNVLSEQKGYKKIDITSDIFKDAIIKSIDDINKQKVIELSDETNKLSNELANLKEKIDKLNKMSEEEKKKIDELEILRMQKEKELKNIEESKKSLTETHDKLIKMLFPLRIIWISDLHFGYEDEKVIEQFLHDIEISYDNRINYLIITGDLTNVGLKSEFKKVSKFIHKLCYDCSLPLDHAIILPGNHDILKESFLRFWHSKKFKLNKGKMKVFQSVIDYKYQEGIGLLIYKKENLGNVRINLYGIDSSYISSLSGGIVGYNTLNEIERRVKSENKNLSPDINTIRILALHHHLKRIPHHEEMESLLLLKDAGTVMKKLKELNFDIIISGHRHTRHMQIELNETLNKKIYIINSPSLSKKGEMERGYYVMEFYDNRLEITYRQYNKDYFEEKEKSILNYSSNGFVKIK